ncbi:MAG: CGNR zinc finger domain-containing protein [Steroidobacteraceae bacterium]
MAATAPFNLCAGHPVLDLVNTLDNRFRADGPTELLPNYAALLSFMEQTGLLPPAQLRAASRRTDAAEAERATDSARELRELAANVLYAVAAGSDPQPTDVRKLARHLQSARQQQELLWSAESKFVWEWTAAAQTEAALPVWILSLQTSALLTSAAMSSLRTCGCETCRWLFLDTSKNHTRRWCDMKICGNRMKARRFQARRM